MMYNSQVTRETGLVAVERGASDSFDNGDAIM